MRIVKLTDDVDGKPIDANILTIVDYLKSYLGGLLLEEYGTFLRRGLAKVGPRSNYSAVL